MKVLLFAQCREAAGCSEYLLQANQPMTAAEFWTALLRAFPALASLQKSARLARGETYLEGGELLDPSDEIAVIPPVSGG